MGDDKTLEILLRIKSDVGELQNVIRDIKGVGTAAEGAAKSGIGMQQAFEFAGANEIIQRLVEGLKETAVRFVEIIKSGVEFNSELQKVQTSIAGLFRQEAPENFPTFEAAKKAAAETIELLKAKANELGLIYSDMFDSFEHAQAQLAAGGVSSVQKQIDLIALLNRAMQSLGVSSSMAARDIGDILQGQAARTLGGGRLAAAMGMTKEELDLWVQNAKESGTLAEDLQRKLGGFQEAGTAASQTFTADLNRMHNAIFDLEAAAAAPIMKPLTESVEALTELFKRDDGKKWASSVGEFIKAFAIDTLIAVHGWAEIEASLERADTKLLNLLPGASALAHLLGSKASTDTGEPNDFDSLMRELLGLNKTKTEGNQILDTGTSKLGEQNKVLEAQKKILDDIAIKRATASGDIEVIAQTRAQKAYDDTLKVLNDIHGTKQKNVDLAKQEYDATYQEVIAVGAKKDRHKDINQLLSEESALIARIHQQQQLVTEDPSISADAKQAQLTNLYIQERAELLQKILKIETAIAALKRAGAKGDQTDIDRLSKALDSLTFKFNQLGLKIKSLTLGGELSNWVNSFGSATHQIAQLIEGSINAALQGTNQLLIDSIFRTGDWRQTLVGVEKQILNLFLTWIEQMALQHILGETQKGISTTTSVSQGAIIAGAHAVPSALVATSTYGTAAIIGEALLIAAVAAIVALASGGFRKGGYTGDGDADEIAGPVHKGEFVLSKGPTQSHGVDNLELLQRGRASIIPHFADGGDVEPSPIPRPHQTYQEWATSPQNDYLPGNFYQNPTPFPTPHRPQMDTQQMYDGDLFVNAPRGFDPDREMHRAPGEPTVEIDPTTGDVAGGAGLPRRPPFGAGAEVDPPWIDHTGLIGRDPGYRPQGGDPYEYAGAPDFSYTNWLNGLMGGFGGPRPEPVSGGWVDTTGSNFTNTGAIQIDPTTGRPYDLGSIPEVTGGIDYTGSNPRDPFGASAFATPPGMTIVGHDTVTGAPIFRGPSGQLFVPPGTGSPHSPDWAGYGRSLTSMENARLMSEMSFGGAPNRMLVPDSGPSWRQMPYRPGVNSSTFGGGAPTDVGHPGWAARFAAWSAGHHYAAGGLIPGAPSQTDNILAWLATGEHVISAPAVEWAQHALGPDFLDQLNKMQIPIPQAHFAEGGAVPYAGSYSPSSSPSPSSPSDYNRQRNQPVNIALFDDRGKMAKWLASSEGRKMIVDTVSGARHEIGIGATN